MSHLTTAKISPPKRANTSTNDACPNKRPNITNNQANNSEASEREKTVNHETIWNFLGFTDELDHRDFSTCWEAVKMLKYNNPELNTLDSMKFMLIAPCARKETWIRLGWYLAKHDFIEKLEFRGVKFVTDEEVEFMFGSVKWTEKKNIKFLDFSHCSITSQGIERLLPFIEKATKISEFHISGNNIGRNGFQLIASALDGRPIKKLSFDDCAVNKIVPIVKRCEFPKLTYVSFSGNQIGDKGANVIANKLLQSSPKLERLGLSKCGISDQGATSIANALVWNTTVKKLELKMNSISDEGVESFAKALRSNHTLQILDLSTGTVKWTDNFFKSYCDIVVSLKANYSSRGNVEEAKSKKERYFAREADGLKCTECLQNKIDFFSSYLAGTRFAPIAMIITTRTFATPATRRSRKGKGCIRHWSTKLVYKFLGNTKFTIPFRS